MKTRSNIRPGIEEVSRDIERSHIQPRSSSGRVFFSVEYVTPCEVVEYNVWSSVIREMERNSGRIEVYTTAEKKIWYNLRRKQTKELCELWKTFSKDRSWQVTLGRIEWRRKRRQSVLMKILLQQEIERQCFVRSRKLSWKVGHCVDT